ncbi:MAG: hypothetical protein L3K06_07220, partial [Thermoplasmata archaeon]|nr:hypothetical protein [Thermoplasmata archaeon]
MRCPRADARATLREDGSIQMKGGTYWDTARHCLAEAPTEVFDVAKNRWRGATRSPAVSRGTSAPGTSNTDAERTHVRVGAGTFLLAHRRERPTLTAL